MNNIRKLTIIKEKADHCVTDQLITRFNELTEKQGVTIQTEVFTYGEDAVHELTGDILLLSLPLLNELPYLNLLKNRFYFVSFIDPYAYAQLDEKRLLKQLQMIEQLETDEIGKFHPRNSWTYTDYFLAATQMKKERAAG